MSRYGEFFWFRGVGYGVGCAGGTYRTFITPARDRQNPLISAGSLLETQSFVGLEASKSFLVSSSRASECHDHQLSTSWHLQVAYHAKTEAYGDDFGYF